MASQTVFVTDFNNGTPSQFSGFINTESVQGFNGLGTTTNVFSGNLLTNNSGGNLGGGGFIGAPQIKTTLTLKGLPAHSSLDLNFLLAVIDNWDGNNNPDFPGAAPDIFNVAVDGINYFVSAFSNFDIAQQNNVSGLQILAYKSDLGFGVVNPPFCYDSAYNFSGVSALNNIVHTANTLTVQWFASGAGWEGGDNESWGIDNVEVILNNDVIMPQLSINDVQIVEGNQGHKNAVFNVQLSQPLDEKVTVQYSTIKGSAKSPSDYTSKNGNITFNPNQTKQTIVIPIKGDTILEGNETFSVKLKNSTNADIADGIGKGTIKNDDVAPPKLSINDVSLFEGNNGTTTAKFTVTLKGKAVEPVKVLYSTANKTAKSGIDFSGKAGSLTFKASNKTQQKQTISVSVKGDQLVENNETFFVNLSSATNGVISDSGGVGTIKNDDNNNLFPQNQGLLGKVTGLDFSRYQELMGSERRDVMTSLDQSFTKNDLVAGINSFVNPETVVI